MFNIFDGLRQGHLLDLFNLKHALLEPRNFDINCLIISTYLIKLLKVCYIKKTVDLQRKPPRWFLYVTYTFSEIIMEQDGISF